MVTSVHGASGDVWMEDKVGVLRPVVYAVELYNGEDAS